MKPSEILREARALIDTPDKWLKGDLHEVGTKGENRYCINGCLNQVICGDPRNFHRDMFVRDLLEKARTDEWDGLSIPEWQDLQKTTHKDVMRLLDRAIKRAEGEGD